MKLLKPLALLMLFLFYTLSVSYAFQYYFTTPKKQVATVLKILYPGDINRDGIVDISDAALIGIYWQKTIPPAPANVDINQDGIVDISDAATIGFNWQKHIQTITQ